MGLEKRCVSRGSIIIQKIDQGIYKIFFVKGFISSNIYIDTNGLRDLYETLKQMEKEGLLWDKE